MSYKDKQSIKQYIIQIFCEGVLIESDVTENHEEFEEHKEFLNEFIKDNKNYCYTYFERKRKETETERRKRIEDIEEFYRLY